MVVKNNTNPIDWDTRAEQSELAYCQSYGSAATEYPHFTHVHHPHIALAGDYNLAIQVKLTDYASFDRLVMEVEQIHRDHGVDKPTCYYCSPPPLDKDKWGEHLRKRGFALEECQYFCVPTLGNIAAPGFHLYHPTIEEFKHWYHESMKMRDDYTRELYETIFPSQLNLIKTFKPFWLMQGERFLGWLYCANLGDYYRLFDVNILAQHHRRGYGTIMLHLIRKEAAKQGASHILISVYALERLTAFYENAGFVKCSRSSIIRKINDH